MWLVVGSDLDADLDEGVVDEVRLDVGEWSIAGAPRHGDVGIERGGVVAPDDDVAQRGRVHGRAVPAIRGRGRGQARGHLELGAHLVQTREGREVGGRDGRRVLAADHRVGRARVADDDDLGRLLCAAVQRLALLAEGLGVGVQQIPQRLPARGNRAGGCQLDAPCLRAAGGA